MKLKETVSLAAALAAFTALAEPGLERLMKVSADRMAADNITGALVASGHVNAVYGPYRLMSESVSRIGGDYTFSQPTIVTTCTNDACRLHWSASGNVVYRDGSKGAKEIVARDMTLRAFGVPVFWVPYWWQPLDTDYGWRVMPGYRSRWGAYLLVKYVYDIAGGFDEGEWGLRGNTRFDVRTRNGVALGQSVGWQLGDFGRGKFKVYYAWDQDADRYDRHWTDAKKWNHSNWGSKVPDERYGLMAQHRWEATERDTLRVRAAYYSDSHFQRDFLRDAKLGLVNRFPYPERNEFAWEHLENSYGLGLSVAGPLNEFYGGVARLPEIYFDVAPQPVFSLPANYESATRLGWLDRRYAKYGRASTAAPYRYSPGEWADYSAFRADTYHRFSLPFRVADMVSVVPRVGLRGTYWSHSGRENLTGYGRAGRAGDDVTRSIVEGGVTFAARGAAWLDGTWQHIVEPYADLLAQEARYSGLRNGSRALWFDSVDGSADYLDQFAGRSRNLPYSWYGATPGVRNAFRRADGRGNLRTVVDIDFYTAVQLNDPSWTEGGRRHRLARHQKKPNHGRSGKATASPGLRAAWRPTEDAAILSRVEWDGQNDSVAYADVAWRQKWHRDLSSTLSYFERDQRRWDFSSSPYDPAVETGDDFNWAKYSSVGLSMEHEICDAVAWGPFVRWDLRENELDEAGAWLDLRTDCLGFRFSLSYENDYRRIDGSEHEDDWRFSFCVYLRALGPDSGTVFGD